MRSRAGRRIKRDRKTWLWVALVLLAVILIFLFLSPQWSGGSIQMAKRNSPIYKAPWCRESGGVHEGSASTSRPAATPSMGFLRRHQI